MTSEPTAQRLADEANGALFRAALAKLTARQRRGLRLALTRHQALQGDSRAAKEFEQQLAEAQRDEAIDACAAEITNDNPGLDEDQARRLAMAALDRSRETEND